MLSIEDKNFKATVINVFKKSKVTILKELKNGTLTVTHQRVNNIKMKIVSKK